MANILIVDDKSDIRDLIADILEDEGHDSVQAFNIASTKLALQKHCFDLIILDIWLEGSKMDGLALLQSIKQGENSQIPIIMISGHAGAEVAALAMKCGAYDLIEKPFKSEKLILTTKRAVASKLLADNNRFIQNEICQQHLIGKSRIVSKVREKIHYASKQNHRVLIQGEMGTGKSLAAKLIHSSSSRQEYKLIKLSLDSMTIEEMERILLGKSQGNKINNIIYAQRGTLLLDGLAYIPLSIQDELLNILQKDYIICNGIQHKLHIRIITTLHQNAEKLIKDGIINRDLYSRLAIDQIVIPSLKERGSDVIEIIEYICDKMYKKFTCSESNKLPKEIISALLSYHWPGNISQLQNTIGRLFMFAKYHKDGDIASLQLQHLPIEITARNLVPSSAESNNNSIYLHKNYNNAKIAFEQEYLKTQLDKFGGNISKTAKFIKLDRTAIHRKLKALNTANKGFENS